MSLYTMFQPLLFRLDAETTHNLALWSLRKGLAGRFSFTAPNLKTEVLGRTFANPLGVAAGLDKEAALVLPLSRLGFGFVEVGSITPLPQPGNPRPRLFRLARDHAVINRMGFNSAGLETAEGHLKVLRDRPYRGVVGVNLGKNKGSTSAFEDYSQGITKLSRYADYTVINVSSPNTPGLRALQGKEELDALVCGLKAVMSALPKEDQSPLVLKIAPDLVDADKSDIADVVLSRGLDGVIVSNTTLERPDHLRSSCKEEQGGLSGAPLFDLSTAVLKEFYQLTGGQVPLIGVGGVSSGAQAYAKIRAGASLVQLYSALVFEGPKLVTSILRELSMCVAAGGFDNVTQAVGADHR